MASEPEDKTSIPDETLEEQEKSVSTKSDPPTFRLRARIRAERKSTQVGHILPGDWGQMNYVAHAWEPFLQGNVFTIKSTQVTEVAAQVEEHKKTREFISEKLSDLANKQDIIETKEEIIKTLKSQIADLNTRLEATTKDLAKTQELEAAASRVCEEVRWQSEESRRQLSEHLTDLRKYLSKFAPHRRFFRVTFGFFFFFCITMLVHSFFAITIIEPFWDAIGMGLTMAMLIVIYFGMRDAQDESCHPAKR
jgi:hypothetical protein